MRWKITVFINPASDNVCSLLSNVLGGYEDCSLNGREAKLGLALKHILVKKIKAYLGPSLTHVFF